MQETDAEHPTIHSGPQCIQSGDHMPFRERKMWRRWDTISQKMSGNWYVTKIAMTEKQMKQLIHWRLTSHSWNLRSQNKKYLYRERLDSSYLRVQYCQNSCNTLLCIRAVQGHTGGDLVEPELMGHVAIPFNWAQFLISPRMLIKLEVHLGGEVITGGQESREGRRLCSSLHWIPGKRRLKNNSKVTCHYKTEWKRAQDAVYWIHLAKAQEKGKNIWANKIACHHCLQESAAWLYREGDVSERWDDFPSATLHTKASSKNNSQICLEISSSNRVIWETSGNWSGRGAKVITTVLRRLLDTAAKTMLEERRTRFKSITEFMECHKTSSTRTRSGWPKYRH